LDSFWTAVGREGQRVTAQRYDVLLDILEPGSRGQPALPDLERKPDPWESAAQATCECLSWRGTLDNLERRNAEDVLGETAYRDFPVHARSVVVTAHELIDRGAFTADELRARMVAVRDRLNRA
jgi:hypothetical protein